MPLYRSGLASTVPNRRPLHALDRDTGRRARARAPEGITNVAAGPSTHAMVVVRPDDSAGYSVLNPLFGHWSCRKSECALHGAMFDRLTTAAACFP